MMDFAKAFDKVAHNGLLYKLSSYGARGNTLGWICHFSMEGHIELSLKGNPRL